MACIVRHIRGCARREKSITKAKQHLAQLLSSAQLSQFDLGLRAALSKTSSLTFSSAATTARRETGVKTKIVWFFLIENLDLFLRHLLYERRWEAITLERNSTTTSRVHASRRQARIPAPLCNIMVGSKIAFYHLGVSYKSTWKWKGRKGPRALFDVSIYIQNGKPPSSKSKCVWADSALLPTAASVTAEAANKSNSKEEGRGLTSEKQGRRRLDRSLSL